MSQEQMMANQEFHQKTIEVLKKLSLSVKPVARVTTTVGSGPFAVRIKWNGPFVHIGEPLYLSASITQDELALLCHLCGVNEKDIK